MNGSDFKGKTVGPVGFEMACIITYNNRSSMPICIFNKTADLPPDNAKDSNMIF